jgi:hypothetical protein
MSTVRAFDGLAPATVIATDSKVGLYTVYGATYGATYGAAGIFVGPTASDSPVSTVGIYDRPIQSVSAVDNYL